MSNSNNVFYRSVVLLLFVKLIIYGQSLFSQPSGKSVVFNGINDYISIADNPSLDQDSAITIEVWINPCDVGGGSNLATKLWCSGSDHSYYFAIVNGKLVWYWTPDGKCSGASNNFESDSSIIQINQWQHVAVTFSTSEVKLYLNGNQISGSLTGGTFGDPLYNSSQPLRIGSYKKLNGSIVSLFRGRMDEFRVWDYPLSSMEIQSRMNDTLIGNEAGLVAYYNMESTGLGAGSTVVNSAINTGILNDGMTFGTGMTPSFLDNTISLDSLDLGQDSISSVGSTILNATNAGTSFLWQDGSTDSILTPMATGWYWVEATIGNCTLRDSVYITLAPLNLDSCSDHPCGESGDRISVCAASGISLCVDRNEVPVFLSNGATCGPCTENDEKSGRNSVITYPNPLENQLNIQLGGNCSTIRLIDQTGRLLWQVYPREQKLQFEVDTTHLPEGFYILKVQYPNGNFIQKRIVKT